MGNGDCLSWRRGAEPLPEDRHIMHNTLTRVRVGLVIGSLLLGAQSASADTITFDLNSALVAQGGTFGAGSTGNTRTYTSGGITLTVSAWAYTFGSSDTALAPAALGKWTPGLGVCNNTEDCEDPQHQVDNIGAEDWVLFQFSSPVDVTSVTIDPSGTWDRDVSYFLRNSMTALNLNGVTYAGLAGVGFGGQQNDSASADDDLRMVLISGGLANGMLFGGFLGGTDDDDDRFKIRSLTATTATVPEPATMLLLVAGSGVLHRLRRRAAQQRHRV
jgi:hypothetical protein